MKRLEALPILFLLLSSQAAFGCGADSGDSPDADGGETASDAGHTSDDAGRTSEDAGRTSDDAGRTEDAGPAVDPSLEGTALETMAMSMEPGTFLYLEGHPLEPELPEGFDSLEAYWNHRTLWSSQDLWSPVAEWDPVTLRTYCILDRTHAPDTLDYTNFLGYDARDNQYIHYPVPPEGQPDAPEYIGDRYIGAAHVYGQWALASDRQKLYRLKFGYAFVYDIPTATWEPRRESRAPGSYNNAQVWNPGIQRVVSATRDNGVEAWDPDTLEIETLATGLEHFESIHGHGVYNAARDEVMLLSADRGVVLVDADGAVSQVQRMPEDVREPGGGGNATEFLFWDPLSGNYLVYNLDGDGRQIWEYSPERDEWAMALELAGTVDNWPPYHGHFITPVLEAGVIIWLHRASPRLYKHASVF